MAKKDIGRVMAGPVSYQIDATEQFTEEVEEKRTRLNQQDCALIRALSGQPADLFSLSFGRVS